MTDPTTALHYTANGNFVNGVYAPGADGFNLADVGSVSELNALPPGVKGLVYLGLTNGADANFQATVSAFIGNPNLYGFYIADEPGAGLAANLKAEADWIHANVPGAKTFIIEQNLSSDTNPDFVYNPANTDIDLFGLDPYPIKASGVDYSIIPTAVSAAEGAGIPLADIVPVYQAFGGGGYSEWTLPTPVQEQQILSTWGSVVPNPAFDYAYSWGVQVNDTALSTDPGLQAVFAAHNSASPPPVVAEILWQNTNGQAAIWEMNGTNVIADPLVGANPGPSWQAIGTGDFTDDGQSDILWQNASTGQASIWEMNGTNVIGGGLVGAAPGPSWQAIGTGDFNDDGHSDILWQNASTGQASIWEMNGTNVIGGGLVGAAPGPDWKVVGTGDFNDDGYSDILWQNTSTGQASIWEMNGTNVIGGGLVGAAPGPSWKAIGTGDFNDDGHSDILWQNVNTGQASIWEMNGTNVIADPLVGANPGPSWKAIGTGDFNDDGHSDILWQNTNGQAAIWEMNGTNVIGEAAVGANPGPSWLAIKA
jgi:hypothetical protein